MIGKPNDRMAGKARHHAGKQVVGNLEKHSSKTRPDADGPGKTARGVVPDGAEVGVQQYQADAAATRGYRYAASAGRKNVGERCKQGRRHNEVQREDLREFAVFLSVVEVFV